MDIPTRALKSRLACSGQVNPHEAVTCPMGISVSNGYRVKRGGSYISPDRLCRSAKRARHSPTWALDATSANGAGTYYSNGYRLIIELE